MPWSEEKKAKIAKALNWDYTSSDVSDMSEDENGGSHLSGYLVKKFTWERMALRNVKKTLDEAYLKSLPVRVRANVLVRRAHPLPSKRGPPANGVAWAVRETTQDPPTARPEVTALASPLETPTHSQPSTVSSFSSATPVAYRGTSSSPVETPRVLSHIATHRQPRTPSSTSSATTMACSGTSSSPVETPRVPSRLAAHRQPRTASSTSSPTTMACSRTSSGPVETPRVLSRLAAPRNILTQTQRKKKQKK